MRELIRTAMQVSVADFFFVEDDGRCLRCEHVTALRRVVVALLKIVRFARIVPVVEDSLAFCR